jgi:hypothetical protein
LKEEKNRDGRGREGADWALIKGKGKMIGDFGQSTSASSI